VVNSSLDFATDRTILFDSGRDLWQYDPTSGTPIAKEFGSANLRFGRLEIDLNSP